MKTREELISYYERQLEKVRTAYERNYTSDLDRDKSEGFIEQARKDLEAVKNGREW